MKGKTVIITSASDGIGKATARILKEKEAEVISHASFVAAARIRKSSRRP